MITSEVQRKLVKSPPELWAELSEETSLARHLGELGLIRITRVEPERTVEWEAEHTIGSVHLEPSGWGTKVTLTVNRELSAHAEPQAEESHEEDSPADEASPADGKDAPSAENAPSAVDEKSEPQAEERVDDELAVKAAGRQQPTPRLGFFARLFRRRPRRSPDLSAEPDAATSDAPERATGETVAAQCEPAPDGTTESHIEEAAETNAGETEQNGEDGHCTEPADLSEQLRAAEEAAAEEVRAVLSSVLDRLGAAHHRPFSRA